VDPVKQEVFNSKIIALYKSVAQVVLTIINLGTQPLSINANWS